MKNKYSWIALCLTLPLFAACSPQPTVEVPETFQAGQKYFHKTCSNCHGSDAMGKKTPAPRLIDEDFLPQNFSDDDIRETIKNGTDKMPSQKNKVTDSEVTEIIKYLRYSQKSADLIVEEEDEEESDESDTESSTTG
jgi:mono/diheme cytochrome c family protein